MTKKTTGQARRVSKKEQRRQKLAEERRRRMLLIGVPVVAVVIALGFIVYSRFLSPIEGLNTAFSGLTRGHDASISFPTGGLPPVGGDHNPTWLNCGIYTSPVNASNAVHSLEHGAVWVSYHPDFPSDQVTALQNKMRGQNSILVSPYPEQSAQLVASAWGAQIVLDGVDDARLDDFIARFRGGGPEPGATCAGGVGTPDLR